MAVKLLELCEKDKTMSFKGGIVHIEGDGDYHAPITGFSHVTYVGGDSNSQTQKNSPGAQQNMANGDVKDILRFIIKLESHLDELKITDEQKQEIEAETKTIRSQSDSPKPKQSIIKESLSSICFILKTAAGTAIGQVLLEEVTRLL